MRNSSRTWLLRENALFAANVPPGSRVLDAGAGEQPYRHLLSHCEYESADFEQVDKEYAKSTYVCDLASIPVEDGRFDAILFNQVMEHLSDPLTVLVELKRVLKPGGKMICTAPLFYEEHEQPYDFYRYTQFAWRHMLGKVGFELEQLIRPQSIAPGISGWLSSPVLAGSRLLFRGLAKFFYVLDERRRFTEKGFPKNYVAIVRKPILLV